MLPRALDQTAVGKEVGGSEVNLTVIIAAYDEAHRLPPFLDRVVSYCRQRGQSFEVIVVDDGSRDRTGELVLDRMATDPEIRLVQHLQNSGKGAAVRTGMHLARGRLRLFSDADGATAIEELQALEQAVQAGADVALASREGADRRVICNAQRRFLGRLLNRLIRMTLVDRIRDTQCGFKLFTAPAAKELFDLVQEDGYGFDIELLTLAQRRGLRLDEVYVDWTEIPGSKVETFRDGWQLLASIFRIRQRWNGAHAPAVRRSTPFRERLPAGSDR